MSAMNSNNAGGWGVLRSFSVYSWNFRMVLRRLHAEYGVNAFFRVDVAAHPNFPDKSIVRVSCNAFSFFYYFLLFSSRLVVDIYIIIVILFIFSALVVAPETKKRGRGYKNQHQMLFIFPISPLAFLSSLIPIWIFTSSKSDEKEAQGQARKKKNIVRQEEENRVE